MNDPFAVLGVPSSATEDEIKSAYRKLAKKYHPDLNPGDKAAEQKMREVNEAYTRALQIKKGGGSSPFGGSYSSSGSSSGNPYGNSYGNPFGNPFGNSYGQSSDGGQRYEYRYENRQQQTGNPFGAYGFDPFAAFFGGASPNREAGFRSRNYANPDLRDAADLIRAGKYTDAMQLLNRIPQHDADWHALYARADLGLGNRISALDHARSAARMSPDDDEYQVLLSTVESGRQIYHRNRAQGGYDFRSMLCGNPCLTCFAANILLNCCCGRAFWC